MKFPARNITIELLVLHMLSLYKMSEGASGYESNKSRVIWCFVSVLVLFFCFLNEQLFGLCIHINMSAIQWHRNSSKCGLFLLVQQPPASKLECSVSRWKKSNMNFLPLVFNLALFLTILMSHACFGHKLPSGQNSLPSLLSGMKIPGEMKIALGPGRP